MLNKNDIINILTKYNFPKNQYCIISGASMVLQGIKQETNDIDISVSQELYDKLLENNSCILEKTLPNKKNVWFLDKLNFSTNYYENIEKFEYGGFSIQTPKDIIKLKKELNREKDKKDIELLESFLKEE